MKQLNWFDQLRRVLNSKFFSNLKWYFTWSRQIRVMWDYILDSSEFKLEKKNTHPF